MIKFSDTYSEMLVRSMWKECFGDSDEFIDLHFSRKYVHNNTLIYFEGGEAAASLQMFPYEISFYGKRLSFYYLAGLCTLPQYRKRGYMAQLLKYSHRVMKERDIALSILVPAEEWLFGFYRKYGYEQVFEADGATFPLKEILDNYSDNREAYNEFCKLWKEKDFYVQKTFDDFVTIVDEFRMDGCPLKYNLAAMAYVVNPELLLSLYAEANSSQDFYLTVNSSTTSTYHIHNGLSEIVPAQRSDVTVDIQMLARLLFGFKTSELPSVLSDRFPEHHPVINLMLE